MTIELLFVDAAGNHRKVAAEPGTTLMEAAVRHGVPGIDADCGGACACGTCHVVLDADGFEKVGPADGIEVELLEFADNRQPHSRLSCQICLTETLAGLVVTIPAIDSGV